MSKFEVMSEEDRYDIFIETYRAHLDGKKMESQINFLSKEIIFLMKKLKEKHTDTTDLFVTNSLILIDLLLTIDRKQNYYSDYSALSQNEKNFIKEQTSPLIFN